MVHSGYIPVVGIVGGIGSGKSSVALEVARLRNVLVIDGDKVGHDLLKAPDVRERIRNEFGKPVFNPDGSVNRRQLGRIVFGRSNECRQQKANLESILHPRIRRVFEQTISAVRTSGEAEAVILDAAVLLESDWESLCDAVVFIDADRPERLRRVSETRGWDDNELSRREESQFPVEKKRESADYVIDNSRGIENAAIKLGQVIDSVERPARPDVPDRTR